MKRSINSKLVAICISLVPFLSISANQLLHEQSVAPEIAQQDQLRAKARNARYLTIDTSLLSELQARPQQTNRIDLPVEDGKIASFTLSPSPILSAELAAKYPHLMTYSGYQIDNPENYGRFSISPQGFFGFYRVNNQWMLLSPQLLSASTNYIAYRYSDALTIDESENSTQVGSDISLKASQDVISSLALKPAPTGDQVRTYRIALSATGEYSQKQGGTIADVIAENMILINRINQILLTDLAIQFELVDNESIIFTDSSTDPFTNNDAASDIDSNQTTVDNLIGSANYDLAHLLSTNGGGLAGIGVVCSNSTKAWGTTGASSPKGERFYIDLVAHELGHQLGARHSFNALNNSSCDSTQRNGTTAYEPGSGTTIMSYAGLCSGQNAQSNSSPYYHAGSIEEIRNRVTTGSGRTCGTLSSVDNTIPQIQLADNAYTIPANTPFVLDATASDADADPLVYSWEQINPGGSDGGTANGSEMRTDNGFNPLFRSFPATSSSKRYFPQLSDIVAQQLTLGETYATTDRDLNIRLTVRDNNGGVNSEDVSVSVVSQTEQFAFTSPDGSVSWAGGSEQTLNWQVANTDTAPINCSNVDIYYRSTDSEDFSEVLMSNVSNDGEQIIQVPNISSSSVRLMLKCSDNIFFALNNSDITLTESNLVTPNIIAQVAISMDEDTTRIISLSDIVVEDSDSTYPDDFSLRLLAGENYSVVDNTLQPNENFNGTLAVNINVSDGFSESDIFSLQVNVLAINDSPTLLSADTLIMDEDSQQTLSLALLTVDDIDSNYPQDFTLIAQSGDNYTIENNILTPSENFTGQLDVSVSVSDGESESNSVNLLIQVNPINDAPVIVSANSLSIIEDSNRLITLNDIHVEDPDSTFPDDFSLTLQAGSNYSVQDNTLTPNSNFNGQLNVNLTVSDGSLNSNVFIMNLSVEPQNDAPVVNNESVSVQQDSQATLINVLSNDSDIDNDTLSLSDLSYNGLGIVTINNQQISYQPASGFNGTESLVYTVSDGQLNTSGTLTITVNPAASIPSDSPSNSQSSGGTFSLLLIFLLFGLSIGRQFPWFKEPHV